ncbi:type VII secretion integral membrane protein EccD [Nocardioides scoriae]|uniref:Type VII secretion integral membrane protein EccD n=1 Tax=Nocardioides scoriae TaxID=642780 RepID=A0A1H1WR22_9ACTN|nr:type VII secretion integral membrane protein EccD [Nocardioides scoriae]SDS98629.1 type VII secretion integral membrane protein EccD [Nocardioides scoriae]
MTQVAAPEAGSEAGGLLRVTVVVGDRRHDLALPGQLPVAELVPELARTLNLLDAETVYAGYTLVASDGRRLDGDLGLVAQGVDPGSVLTLAAGVDQPSPRVYDDVVEAMADAVESDLAAWDPATGRRTALAAAGLVLALGALALGLQRPDVVAGAAAGVSALVLVVAGVVLSRTRAEHETAVTLSWAGVVFAAVAGVTAAPAGAVLGLPAAIGAGGALAVGLVAVFGLAEHRAALVPAAAVGAGLGVANGIVAATSLDPQAVHTVLLVVVVLAGSALPWVALSATTTRVPQAQDHAQLTAEAAPVDAGAVRRDARIGHEVLLAVTATVGLLLVLVAPMAVSLGLTGALVAVCACLVLLLRTRQYRVGPEVVTGLGCAVASFASLCVGIVLLQREWLPVLAVVLAVTAVVLLVTTLVPRPASVRWGRLGDVAELTALVAMVPLAVVAVGVVAAVTS